MEFSSLVRKFYGSVILLLISVTFCIGYQLLRALAGPGGRLVPGEALQLVLQEPAGEQEDLDRLKPAERVFELPSQSIF
jgi:hypothetical protein